MENAAQKHEDYRHGHRQRLRERYARSGIESLADHEVVEMFLSLVIPRVDVKPVAKDLLGNFKSLRGILDAPQEELVKISGVGETAALGIKFVKDMIAIYHANEMRSGGDAITTISKLIKFFKSKIASEQNEVLEMLCFDSQLRIIGDSSIRLVEGSVNSANLDIRKIIEIAIKRGATSIAIAHNHPSGDPRPSSEDIRFTRKLSAACRPISLSLIEHVIIAKGAVFSFRKNGHFDCLYDEAVPESQWRGKSVAERLERLI